MRRATGLARALLSHSPREGQQDPRHLRVQRGVMQPPRPQCMWQRQGAPARVQQRARVHAAEVGAQQARAGVERGQRGRRAVGARRARRRALVQHQHVRELDLSRAQQSA